MMEFNGHQLDWISQHILVYLWESDGYESVNSLEKALATETNGVTAEKIRYRLREHLVPANLVSVETEPRERPLKDKKWYRIAGVQKGDEGDGQLYMRQMREKLVEPECLQDSELDDLRERIEDIEELVDYHQEWVEVAETKILRLEDIVTGG